MYNDDGKLNVELLADVGDIAHRLRHLDKKLSLDLNDPRLKIDFQNSKIPPINVKKRATAAPSSTAEDEKSNNQCSNETIATGEPSTGRRASAAAQIAQDISERISGPSAIANSSTNHPSFDIGCHSQSRRYSNKQIEDIILDFYEKHLIYHQNQEKEGRLVAVTSEASALRKSRIQRLSDIDSDKNNMNNLLKNKTESKCSSYHGETADTSLSGTTISSLASSSSSSSSSSSPSATTLAATTTPTEQTKSNKELIAESTETNVNNYAKRNSLANQPMPEIQISNSDEQVKIRKSLAETTFESKDIDRDIGSTDDTKNVTYETTVTGGTCSHYCAGWQTSIYNNQLNEDDLRALVMELKHKIEFTERMNWLYLSKRPAGPPHRKTSLPKHTDVKKRFMEICDQTLSDEIKSALRLPAFDSYEWEDEDVLFLMQTMFIDTGLVDKFNIPLPTLREWLYEVYKHYNAVPFHNFRHCFCVAQMMYAITCKTNLSARLGDLEVLILLVSCICHDLDHPGYNNIYQINARTELALRYNDISPLENHHCSIAFRLLEHPDCNIFKHFSKETFNEIREGIIRCILATDMARHNEILTQFQEVSPNFDFTNEGHINLLCMVLIKVADISNEARPMDIAEPWLERLLQEFFAQSAAEKLEGLPVTPFMDPDKVSKPGSQVRFIGLVLLPLFEALGELLPELVDMIIQPVRDALDFYKKLNDAQNRTRKSLGDVDGSSDASPQMPRSQSGISVRSRRSIPSQKSTSRNSVDEPLCISAELHDLPEGSESGDSETATEVDIAEKTSKFKVDTESGNRNKNMPNSSRKGSREKRPSMISEMYTTGVGSRMRGSHGNIPNYHNNRSNFGANRAVSLDQYSTHNRRSSDGLQQVTSDNNVYYNHHHHHHHHHAHAHHNQQHRSLDDHPATITETLKLNKAPHDDLYSGGNIRDHLTPSSTDEKVKDKHAQQLQQQQQQQPQQQQQQQQQQHHQQIQNQQHKYTSSKILSTASSAANNGTKSFMSRLRQFSSRFSFTFDRDAKHNNTNTNITRNNNAHEPCQPMITTKGNFCCAHKHSLSPLHQSGKQLANSMTTPTTTTSNAIDSSSRNRAHSLDVVRTRQYSSSNSADSRKSSRNDDHNHIMLMMEDNSNQTTTIGDNKSDGDESFSVCIACDANETGNSI